MGSGVAARDYAQSLLIEECGELLQLIGKAGRFGLDTPEGATQITDVDGKRLTSRMKLCVEAGDLLAAIDYAIAAGVLDSSLVTDQDGGISDWRCPAISEDLQEDYALSVVARQVGRVVEIVGLTMCSKLFGDPIPYPQFTRNRNLECRKLFRAINWIIDAGIIDGNEVLNSRRAKLAKLLDGTKKDNVGRRLAPAVDNPRLFRQSEITP